MQLPPLLDSVRATALLRRYGPLFLPFLLWSTACLERQLKALNPCLVSGVTAEVSVDNVDKVDLLFMIDDSTSMTDKQHALRVQMPHLMKVLTSGDKDGDGIQDFPPPSNMHIGVVSSDMGLPGVQGISNCVGLGDDGILQNQPHPDLVQGCQASYPPFLSFIAGTNDPAQTATDFACIAALGTAGCGIEQQLEAPLKALWPAVDPMPVNGKNRIVFLADPTIGKGTTGHGDVENAGFLRNDAVHGLSLIAIIVLTDEDDSSVADTSKYLPPQFLDPNDPLAAEPLNLRPIDNPGSLYPIERYVNGFKALRPGRENLVVFGAITGVPSELVDANARARVDFSDTSQRDAFYQTILSDPRMQPKPASTSLMDGSGGLLVPCCQSTVGSAVPGRRVVQVAQGFGENGAIYSICQDDYAPALDGIVDIIARQLGAVCLPRSLVRNASGLVDCNVVWQLPPPATALTGTPIVCGGKGFEFLLDPSAGADNVNALGGQNCRVAQLAVQADATGKKSYVPTPTDGREFSDGWFYDDFSDELTKSCQGTQHQRVAFTPRAKPPSGVTVKLECLNEAQTVAQTRTDLVPDIDQPAIGSACDQATLNGKSLSGDAACAVTLIKPSAKWPDGIDRSMFCHSETNTCVLGCNGDNDCPPAWVCDARPTTLAATKRPGHGNGTAICVNPTCGTAP